MRVDIFCNGKLPPPPTPLTTNVLLQLIKWCAIIASKHLESCLMETLPSLQSGVTLCWVPSTLCSSTMAAMGPGEVARAGSGGTAACLSGPGGAYTSAGSSSQQPTGVRRQDVKNLLLLLLFCFFEILVPLRMISPNNKIDTEYRN